MYSDKCTVYAQSITLRDPLDGICLHSNQDGNAAKQVKFTDDSVGARKTISMYLVAAQTNVTRSNDTFKS